MSETRGARVKESLSGREIHDDWESNYRSDANERFYELAFDGIVERSAPAPGSRFLDVGCGPGFHAMRLARRGFDVTAVDFSEAVLEEAARNVERAGLAEAITVQREDLLDLSFEDGQFENVLCWGVLMHIPDVAEAIAELCRVTAPGGLLVIAEGNTRSIDAALLRLVDALGRRGGRESRPTAAGVEYWKQTEAGPLMTRMADVEWLESEFGRHGAEVEEVLPAEFTELYTKVGWDGGKRALHALNRFWFSRVGSPRLAEGAILIMRKRR